MNTSDMTATARGVLISVVAVWWATTLVTLWFLLSGNTTVAAIWLCIQALSVAAVGSLGWSHLCTLAAGPDAKSPYLLHPVFYGVALSCGAVYIAHGMINGAA